METIFDINVNDRGNATVTQADGAAVAETKFTFKASGPLGNGTVIVFDEGSPDFKVEGSANVLKAKQVQPVPCTLIPIEQPPRRHPPLKVPRHFDCGHTVPAGSTRFQDFRPWGTLRGVLRGGGLTPPIGGGNGA